MQQNQVSMPTKHWEILLLLSRFGAMSIRELAHFSHDVAHVSTEELTRRATESLTEAGYINATVTGYAILSESGKSAVIALCESEDPQQLIKEESPVKFDALNRPIPENHPLRINTGDFKERNSDRAKNDLVAKKRAVGIKRAMDALQHERELKKILTPDFA